MTIGLVEGDPEYLFTRISGGILMPDGKIAIADYGARAVRLYESDGSFVRDLGSRGEGPGEFQRVSAVWGSGATVSVFDDGSFRLTRFGTDGSVLETRQIVPGEQRPTAFLGEFSNGDLALAWIRNLFGQGPSADTMAFGRFNHEGGLTRELGFGLGFRRGEHGTLPFSPRWNAAVYRDSVYFTDGLDPGISVWSPEAQLARTIPLPNSGHDIEEAWKGVRAELQARGDVERLRRFEEAPRPTALPEIARMFIDPEGRIWVKRYDPSLDSNALSGFLSWKGGVWWVLDHSGAPLATVPMPEEFMPLHVRGDRILGFFRDDLRVERVQVYRILEG